MNPTILKIIDLMFRGVPDTEETAAMREELLTNSQARYEDLIAAGLSPDDALGQVLDNLRGMEEVLDEYRSGRRTAPTAPTLHGSGEGFAFDRFERMAEEIDQRMERIGDKVEATAENAFSSARNALDTAMQSMRSAMDGLGENLRTGCSEAAASMNSLWQQNTAWGHDDEATLTAVFQPGEVHRISMQLAGEDIEVSDSPDGKVHVEINKADEPMLQLELSNGTLMLKRVPHRRSDVQQDMENEELEGFGGIFAGIGRALRGVLRSDRTSGEPVRLLVPEGIEQITLQTASGDIDLSELRIGSLTAATTSGDLVLENVVVTGAAHLTSTSGDVDVDDCDFGESLTLGSTSGDIDLTANAPRLNANNVSGDIDLEGRFQQVKLNSVSGDIDLRSEEALQSVQANTTSGDIEVMVPDTVVPCVSTNTTCGDVSVHCPTNTASPVQLRLNTVSGDITVCNF